jgi:hypothetical protein
MKRNLTVAHEQMLILSLVSNQKFSQCQYSRQFYFTFCRETVLCAQAKHSVPLTGDGLGLCQGMDRDKQDDFPWRFRLPLFSGYFTTTLHLSEIFLSQNQQ